MNPAAPARSAALVGVVGGATNIALVRGLMLPKVLALCALCLSFALATLVLAGLVFAALAFAFAVVLSFVLAAPVFG